MKITLCLVPLFLIFLFATAQQSRVDSLEARLKVAKSYKERTIILKQLAEPQKNDASTMLRYAKEGLILSQKVKQANDEIIFLQYLSQARFKLNDPSNSLEIALKGIKLSRKLNNQNELSYFFQAMASAYQSQKQYGKAIGYFLQALQAAIKANNTIRICGQYSNLGNIYLNINKLDSARRYFNLLRSQNLNNNKLLLAYNLSGYSRLQYQLKHLDSALIYARQSLNLFAQNDPFGMASDIKLRTAVICSESHQTDSAGLYAYKAYQEAKQKKQYGVLIQASAFLAGLYEGHDNAKSIFYYKEQLAAKDSLNEVEQTKRFQLTAQKELDKEQTLRNAAIKFQNSLISQKNRQQKNLLLFLIVVIIAIGGLAFGLFRNNKFRQLANIKLQNEQDKLKATQTQLIQSEKMASLGELTAGIAHEIQNPLNFVNNFSEVNTELIDEMQLEIDKGDYEEVKAIANDIKENQQKINQHGKRADAIVKGMLQHSQSGSGVKEPTNINALADEYIRLAYHGLRAKDKSFNAEMFTHVDPGLPMINVIPQDIGRVFLNLFNNAFYAVNQKSKTIGADYKPEVSVTISAENGLMIVKVKDNGIGIPDDIKEKIMQPFFTTKPTGEGTGLGLSLTYDMVVKGHGGSIDIESNEGNGSTFILKLPIS